ncbi:hypothetical protein I6A60_15480 [Frankia sp. AgB1.9]|uniref:hypothetical protein n=1 Tax=unclassified Frankia TaxID=2632575 RepID=UPI00193148F2|nr:MULTISPECIES: hypothetical protein [unclassified Frankia]MBL7492793.1 hypothetical protein [Frankia sp. AgW1.1]MBL7549276.1 hypothetical protein [Frankia sp. AgB1.9]MBL7619256.1 hypothetical protein [Frankia sp. AgB1.8]
MRLRDAIEQTIRAWDAYERDRGTSPIVDYDCAPAPAADAASSRLEVLGRLTDLHAEAERNGDQACVDQVRAHLAYLGALLGERAPLTDYVAATQGCPTAGWSEDYITEIGDRARHALGDLDLGWDAATAERLDEIEGPVDGADAPELIRAAAGEMESKVRALTGTSTPYNLTIETAEVDAYWAYWLDGAGPDVRLRFNLRNAAFTKVRIRQFAQHEILGHALQYATYAAQGNVTWPRLLAVHLPHQVLCEGLAQAMPLFIAPDDAALIARVRLDHYLQLVRTELHRAINTGATATDCAAHARSRVPFWTDNAIGDMLTDRSADPQLRSYLWAYPAGIDWFVNLADNADADTVGKVFRAAYTQPLTPHDLTSLWPSGPSIGGPGAPVRLRKPPGP